MEAEMGVLHLQPKEYSGLLTTTRNEEETRKDPPAELSEREHGWADTFMTDLWPPEQGNNKLLWFSDTQFVAISRK